ncbi:2,3-diaminopropionate biosynthesis protein SbnB [soil metagenome]
MLYLNDNHIIRIGIDWSKTITTVEEATKTIAAHDFAQPIKPYLRYRDVTNRIIAMPAFVGGSIELAGIKWIASFPANVTRGLKRANSVTILNNASTGVPVCAINSTMVSGIRTASVSGLILREWLKHQDTDKKFKVGITGFGPIGKLHAEMVQALLGERLTEIKLFDTRTIVADSIPASLRSHTTICESWQEAFNDADIFITCTVSKKRYINDTPKKNSIHLNVSLRDYEPSFRNHVDFMIVDDWEEVCRESTDIEMMHQSMQLTKAHTHSVVDVVVHGVMSRLKKDDVVMFNPMGMAVYDIALGGYYYDQAVATGIHQLLED